LLKFNGLFIVPLNIKCPPGQFMLYFPIGHILLYRKFVLGNVNSRPDFFVRS